MLQRWQSLLLTLVSTTTFAATVSPSQYMKAHDLQDKPPLHHNIHLQAPNGQQARVIVLGPAALNYDIRVSVQVKGDTHRSENCGFSLEHTPQTQIPTCILDFSEPNDIKKINLNDPNQQDDPQTDGKMTAKE